MRIVDADILSYALFEDSPAYTYAWDVVQRALKGEIETFVTHTTILEAYNTLYWFYQVRPRRALLEKISLVLHGIDVLDTSKEGVQLAASENIPLGDGFLIATASAHRVPIIVSSDEHVRKVAPRHGLIVENPVPEEVMRKLGLVKK